MISPRFAIKRLLASLGYELRRSGPVRGDALPGWLTDPVTAEYLPHHHGTFAATVDLGLVRGLHVMGLPLSDAHPFVRASLAGMDAAEPTDAIKEVLTDYYARICPQTAAQAVGLSEDEAPGLSDQDPIACLVPWSARDVAETISGRKRAMREVGMQYHAHLTEADGFTAFGPTSQRKCEFETARIAWLMSKVAEEGFIADDPRHPIKSAVLRRDMSNRWLIEEGHHRLPLAMALGMSHLPIIATQIVRAEDAALWPRVADGTFTASGARKMFDRLFDARPHPLCEMSGW